MNKYLRRLRVRDQYSGENINPLIWPFATGTFLYGACFGLLNLWNGTTSSSLYDGMNLTSTVLPEIWGFFAALSAVLCVVFLTTRNTIYGAVAAFMGFLVWLYAGWVYLEQDRILVAIAVAGGNAYFWAWLYMRTMWYKRQRGSGNLTDPE